MQTKSRILLANDYTVAAQVPDEDYFIHDPGMTVLPDGSYIVFSPCWSRKKASADNGQTKNFQIDEHRQRLADHLIISKSYDKGKTWTKVCELPYAEATPIVHDGILYLFTQYRQHGGVYFISSQDGGDTWTDAVQVIDAPLWNCQTSMVKRDGTLYWCMDSGHNHLTAVACDLNLGIMNPKAWRTSATITLPSIPNEIVRGFQEGDWLSKWPGGYALLEPNVVEVGGKMMALARVVIDEYATANLCAVFDIEDRDGKLAFTFRQYYALPGGQCKFHIEFDEASGLFWMASNLPTNSWDLLNYRDKLSKTEFMGGTGNERRILSLWYSLDAVNWIPAGIVAMAKKMLQSFMYPSMVIDGDDLVILARSSIHSSNQHDADYSTFHTIANFRELALDLRPEFDE